MNEFRIGGGAALFVTNLLRVLDGAEVSVTYSSTGTPFGSVTLCVRKPDEPWAVPILRLDHVMPDECLNLTRTLGLERVGQRRIPESITDVIWRSDDVDAVWRTPPSAVREG